MKNLKEALKQLQEEKSGLWANIRAKRARGEKPAHKNSKAHKDAVKAGKKINAMSEQAEWPQGTQSRYQEYSFKLIKVMPDRAKYSVTDMETGELKGTVVFNTVDQLHDYAADLIRPQGGRQSSHFGTNEGVDSDIETIIKLVKSAKNPKNLPISFGTTSVAIGGTQYDKGELVSMFNGKELGMDSMDIRKVFYNANKDAEAIADKINASNSGVEAKIGHGYGKKPILYLKRK